MYETTCDGEAVSVNSIGRTGGCWCAGLGMCCLLTGEGLKVLVCVCV